MLQELSVGVRSDSTEGRDVAWTSTGDTCGKTLLGAVCVPGVLLPLIHTLPPLGWLLSLPPFTDDETESPPPGEGGGGGGTSTVQGDSGVLALMGCGQVTRVGLGLLGISSQVLSHHLVLPSPPGCQAVIKRPG